MTDEQIEKAAIEAVEHLTAQLKSIKYPVPEPAILWKQEIARIIRKHRDIGSGGGR